MYIQIQILQFYVNYKLWYLHVYVYIWSGQFLQRPPLAGLLCLKILLFSISTPENLYLNKNISIWGGLEAEILIHTQIWSAIL